MTGDKPKRRLSKLAALSLAIPLLLIVLPYYTFHVLIRVFGNPPPDPLRSAFNRLSPRLPDCLVAIPAVFTCVLTILLSVPAIVRVCRSHGALRGDIYAVFSLLLIPLYYLAGITFSLLLWGYLANML